MEQQPGATDRDGGIYLELQFALYDVATGKIRLAQMNKHFVGHSELPLSG